MSNVPFFLSSTFNDMQSERDLFRERITPEIESRFKKFGMSVEFIDLRWGIDTKNVSENDANEKILKTCFDEIQKTRPFFIALIGERYGWIPDGGDVENACADSGLDVTDEYVEKSVTELEIACALHSYATMDRCLFYFRDPVDYGGDGAAKKLYVSDGVQREKIEALKKRLKQKYPKQVRAYKAVWNGELQKIEGLDEFERQITQDIENCLKEELSAELVPANALDESLNVIRSTVENLSSSFAGREDEIQKIRSYIEGTEGRVLLVSGNSGCGKSSIMAKTAKLCGDAGYITLPFFAGADVNCSTAENMLKIIAYRLCNILEVQPCFDPDGGEADVKKIAEQFNQLLNRAVLKGKTVLIVDAVNQFAATEYENKFKWLNLFALNPSLRIIISATSDYEQLKYVKALDCVRLDVDYFSDGDIATIVRRYFAVNHKEINDLLLNEIVGKTGADGNPCRKPLYLMTLLQELNNIGTEDFRAIRERELQKGESSVDAIINYLAETARSSPSDFSMQLSGLFEKVKAKAGETECEIYACAIAASRRGVNERFIEKLFLRRGEEFRSASFSYFKKLMKNDLCQRENGAWDFSHGLVKDFFLEYFSKKPLYNELLEAAADCLDAEDDYDVFKRTEFVRYLALSDSLDRFVPYYVAMNGDKLVNLSLTTETQELQKTPDVCDKLLYPVTGNTRLIWKFFEGAVGGGAYLPQASETYANKVFNCVYTTDYAADNDTLRLIAGIYYGLGGVALDAGYSAVARDYFLMSLAVCEKADFSDLKYGIYSRLATCSFKLGNGIKRKKYWRLAEDALTRQSDGGGVGTLLGIYFDDCRQKIDGVTVNRRAVNNSLNKMRALLTRESLTDGERALWYSRILYIGAHINFKDDESAARVEEYFADSENSFARAEALFNLGVYYSNRSLKESKRVLECAEQSVKQLLAAEETVGYLKLYDSISEYRIPLSELCGEDCKALREEQSACLKRLNLIAPEYGGIARQLELGESDKERKKELKTLRRTVARGQASAEHKAANIIIFAIVAAVAFVFTVIFPLFFSVFRGQAMKLFAELGKTFSSVYKLFVNFYIEAAFEAFTGLCLYLGVYGLMQIFRPKNDYKMRVTWIMRCVVLFTLFGVLLLIYFFIYEYFHKAGVLTQSFAQWEFPYIAVLYSGLLLVVVLFNQVFNLFTKEFVRRPKIKNYGRFVGGFKCNLLACLVDLGILAAIAGLYWAGQSVRVISGWMLLPPKYFIVLAGVLAGIIVAKAVYLTVMRFVIKVRYGKEIKG